MQHGNSGKEKSEPFPPGNHYKGRKETSFLSADSYKHNIFYVEPHFCHFKYKIFSEVFHDFPIELSPHNIV